VPNSTYTILSRTLSAAARARREEGATVAELAPQPEHVSRHHKPDVIAMSQSPGEFFPIL